MPGQGPDTPLPPPTTPEATPASGAFGDFFNAVQPQPEPQPPPQVAAQPQPADPWAGVFDSIQPPAQQAQPVPMQQPAPAPAPQPMRTGGPTGPMGPPGHPPFGATKRKAAPQKLVPPPPPMKPTELQLLAHRALVQGDHFAAGVIHNIQAMGDTAAANMLKGAVKQGQQTAQESEANGPFNPEGGIAGVMGAMSGVVHMAQDAKNALVNYPTGAKPDRFAEDFDNLKGVKSFKGKYPGAFGVAQTGGGMAAPIGIPMAGAGIAAKAGGMIAREVAPTLLNQVMHGAAAGAAYGGLGSVGQQYAEHGKQEDVDLGKAAESAEAMAGIGGLAGGAAHAIGKAAGAHGTAPENAGPDQAASGGTSIDDGPAKGGEGTRQSMGHQRKDYSFIDQEVKAQLLKQDQPQPNQGPAGDAATAQPLAPESDVDWLKLHKKIIGGKEVKLRHQDNVAFEKAQADYKGQKKIIEDMYSDDDVLKRKELAALADSHYKGVVDRFGTRTVDGIAPGLMPAENTSSGSRDRTESQTDYTKMSDSELENLNDEHNLTLKKAEKGLTLPRGAQPAAERELKAIGQEKINREIAKVRAQNKADLEKEASSQENNQLIPQPETPAAQAKVEPPILEENPTLEQTEKQKYPNHRDQFNTWERTGGQNILMDRWFPHQQTDGELNQHIEALDAVQKEQGKLGIRQAKEYNALTQERARRAERVANGHETDWPQDRPPADPEYAPPADFTKLSDDELINHFDRDGQAEAEAMRRMHEELSKPEPQKKEYTFRKTAKGYEIINPEGEVHSSPKEKEAAVQARVDKLNSGELAPTKGAKDSYKTTEKQGEQQQKIISDASLPKPEHAIALDEMAENKHAFDEARAKYNATYDAWQKSQPPEMIKTEQKPAFRYDRAAEDQVMGEMPELTGYEVQNARKISGQFKQSKAKGPGDLGRQIVADRAEMVEAEKKYKASRKTALDAIGDERGPILVPHPKGPITIRKVPTGQAKERLMQLTQPEMEESIKRDIGPVNKFLKGLEEAYKPNGTSMATFPGVPQMASALKAVKAKYGADIDARTAHRLLMNELNSDIYNRTADPAFNHARMELDGKMDLNFQGVEKLHTQEQKDAWRKNRYSRPPEIIAGKNDADKLNLSQRHALVGQNEIMNDMADLYEQYSEHLKKQGYDGEGLKAMVPGKQELAATLKTDLAALDRGKYGSKSMAEKIGKQVTSGIYDMYVTGNWPIHQLHAIEATSVGSAYHPIAFGKAVTGLASHAGTRDFVKSFDSSSGNMKSIREDSDTILGKHWRALQSVVVGGKKNAQALASNHAVQLAGEVLEGSIAEKAKLHLIRAQSAHIAAEEMKYPGGGSKLMEDMNNAQTMDPVKRLEAASKIVYHMNQMIGYSPSGLKDLNIFGRLGKNNPLIKWFTPFTTTRIQQSRVLTKFFSQAAHNVMNGDGVKAGMNVGQGLMMLGGIALIGGRAAVPRELQDALHYADPQAAKDFLQRIDNMNYIGNALDIEVEHVTPQLIVPAYLGDPFPIQLLSGMNDASFGKEKAQWRGAATVLAAMGIASIGDRLGLNSILKLHKAWEEGTKGEYQQYAGALGNTGTSIANAGVQISKAAKNLGLPVDPAHMKTILGSKFLPTSVPQRIGNVIKTGNNISAAEFINAVRDDNAFGDALNRLDPKLYKRLSIQNSKLSKSYATGEKDAREPKERILKGFWERQYKQYMERKNQTRLAGMSA